jgi:hypothetical protein
VYAILKTTNGGVVFEVMPKAEVDHIRKCSKAPNSPAWEDWYDEMALKTVIRRLGKRTPLSPDLMRASSMDEGLDAGVSQSNAVALLAVEKLPAEIEAVVTADVDSEIQDAVTAEVEKKTIEYEERAGGVATEAGKLVKDKLMEQIGHEIMSLSEMLSKSNSPTEIRRYSAAIRLKYFGPIKSLTEIGKIESERLQKALEAIKHTITNVNLDDLGDDQCAGAREGFIAELEFTTGVHK